MQCTEFADPDQHARGTAEPQIRTPDVVPVADAAYTPSRQLCLEAEGAHFLVDRMLQSWRRGNEDLEKLAQANRLVRRR